MRRDTQLEDKLLAFFSGTGGIAFLAQFLLGSNDPHYQAVGALLIAIGGVLKAFVPSKQQAGTPAGPQ